MSERASSRAVLLRELSADPETSAYVECMRRRYPTAAKDARRIVDEAMGERTLTDELYKMRNEEAM